MQTGERVLITSGDGLLGYVSAKSRYPTPSEIPLPIGTNPLLPYIAFYNQGAQSASEEPVEPEQPVDQEDLTQTDTPTTDVKESL